MLIRTRIHTLAEEMLREYMYTRHLPEYNYDHSKLKIVKKLKLKEVKRDLRAYRKVSRFSLDQLIEIANALRTKPTKEIHIIRWTFSNAFKALTQICESQLTFDEILKLGEYGLTFTYLSIALEHNFSFNDLVELKNDEEDPTNYWCSISDYMEAGLSLEQIKTFNELCKDRHRPRPIFEDLFKRGYTFEAMCNDLTERGKLKSEPVYPFVKIPSGCTDIQPYLKLCNTYN